MSSLYDIKASSYTVAHLMAGQPDGSVNLRYADLRTTMATAAAVIRLRPRSIDQVVEYLAGCDARFDREVMHFLIQTLADMSSDDAPWRVDDAGHLYLPGDPL